MTHFLWVPDTQKEVRNPNRADYNAITDSFHLNYPEGCKEPVDVSMCSLDTHLFLSCEGMCAGFGGGGLDHSFLRIRLMTAFHLTILHSGKGFLFGFF